MTRFPNPGLFLSLTAGLCLLFFVACGDSTDPGGTNTDAAPADVEPADTPEPDTVPIPDTAPDPDIADDTAPPPDDGEALDIPEPDTAPPEDVVEDGGTPEDTPTPLDTAPPDVPEPQDATPPSTDVVIEHLFNQVEQTAAFEPLLQTVDIDLPADFVSVEAQIQIRGDLDSFPMAFMTFMVEKDGQLKQCGNVSGLPQKPNNILDDIYRIAWPFPANLDKQSVFYPPSPPFDFQPLPCAEWFQGKSSIKIGMLGVGISPPGVGGNQGLKACGGAGCPNDAIVTLVFKKEFSDPDVGVWPEDAPTPDVPVVQPPTGPGSCGEPTPFTLSSGNPSVSLNQPGNVIHNVPWPPIGSACATSKPPNALEYFYQLELQDYGYVNFDLSYDPIPWIPTQYFLDLQATCESAYQCGKSSQALSGVAQPGTYLVGITHAPVFEVYPPEETDWTFTLDATLTPLDWGAPQDVATGADLQLAFNNTKMATRDGQGLMHAVWSLGGQPQHGALQNGAWVVQDVPKPTGPAGHKPTIAKTNGDTLLLGYTQKQGDDTSAAVVHRSADSGTTWSDALILSGVDAAAAGMSLHGYAFVDGTPGGVAAWHDETTGHAYATYWQGGPWDNTGWSAPVALDTTTDTAQDVSVGGRGEVVVAAWEDNRAAYKQIFRTVSLSGGQFWELDDAINVSQSGASASAGQDPSVAIAANGDIFIAYQDKQKCYMVRSQDQGQTFQKHLILGMGLFANVAVNDQNHGIVTWEQFAGDPMDNSQKTVGTAFSFDSFGDAFGPSFMKDSNNFPGWVMASPALSDQWLDVFWIDTTTPQPTLKHRTMAVP